MKFEFPVGDTNLQLFTNEFNRIFTLTNTPFFANIINDDLLHMRIGTGIKSEIKNKYKIRIFIQPSNVNLLEHDSMNVLLGENNQLLAITVSHISKLRIKECQESGQFYNVKYKSMELVNSNYNRYAFYF